MSSDHSLAAELRDQIRKIVEQEMRRLSPTPRIGQVLRIDRERGVCYVIFPGDDEPITVSITPGIQPRHAAYDVPDGTGLADTVRVGGRAGNYYLMDVVDSSFLNLNYEEKIEGIQEAIENLGGGTDGIEPDNTPDPVVRGGIRSLFVEWGVVSNDDYVHVHVWVAPQGMLNTTQAPDYVVAGAGPGLIVIREIDGLTPVPGTNYDVQIQAVDEDGPGPLSNIIQGTPLLATTEDMAVGSVTADILDANSVTAGKLQSVLSVSNRFEVGSYMSLEAGQGLKTEPPNGKSVQIRDDGGTSIFEGEITVDRAIITDFLDIQGSLGKISGLVNLADGVVAPLAAPVISTSWSSPLATQETQRNIGAGPGFDLKNYDEQNWLYLETVYDAYTVWAMNKVSGERILLFSGQGIMAVGIERVGDHILIIGKKFGNGDRFDTVNGQDRFRLFMYSLTGVFENVYEYAAADMLHEPAISSANSGTIFFVSFVSGRTAKNLRVEQFSIGFTPATSTHTINFVTSIVDSTPFPYTAVNEDMNLTGACVSLADYDGVQKYLFVTTKDYVLAHFITFTSTITALSYNHMWTKPNNELMRGIAWWSGRFHTGGATTGRVYHFSKQMGIFNYQWRFSYYDGNATGGTHETQGGLPVTFQNTRRHWIRVATPSPVVQAGGVDDPDSARFYANNKLQATVAGSQNQNSVIFLDEISQTGIAAPTSNGFASVPGQNGAIQSSKEDADGKLIELQGSGGGRVGPLSWDASGNPTRLKGIREVGETTLWPGSKASIPAGWLCLDGSSFSSATYPKLATFLGGTVLPDMTDLSPIGAGTKAVKTSGGSFTKSLLLANIPSHTHPFSASTASDAHDHTIAHTHTLTATSSSNTHSHGITRKSGTGSSTGLAQGSSNVLPDANSLSDTHSHTVSGTTSGSSAASSGSTSHSHTVSGTSGATGSGAAFDVTNPWRAFFFIIKAT